MTREQKLEAIYKEMANKELAFGCKLRFVVGSKKSEYAADYEWKFLDEWIVPSENVYEDEYQIFYNYTEGTYIYFCTNCEESVLVYSKDFEIIWHPVTIGDVIDWIEPYWAGYAQDVRFTEERRRKINLILLQWDKKREPIEAQSDECIDFIYSLIP